MTDNSAAADASPTPSAEAPAPELSSEASAVEALKTIAEVSAPPTDGDAKPEDGAAPAPEGEGTDSDKPTKRAKRFAQLAAEERQLRQRERALEIRRQQLQQQNAPKAKPPLSADQQRAMLLADPEGFLRQNFGVGLQDVAAAISQAPESNDARALRAELAEVQQKLQHYERSQVQSYQAYQWQQAHGGLVSGLQKAQESYPHLVEMLGVETAATAILQGVRQAYYDQEQYKTADEVAEELENHLSSIADRLVTAKTKKSANSTAKANHPQSSTPTPSAKLNNRSTASPQAAGKPRSRDEAIAQAANLLQFTER